MHQLEDPWGDQAIPVHFETPDVAAYTVMEALRGQDVSGILASVTGPPLPPLMPRVVWESATTILQLSRLAGASCA